MKSNRWLAPLFVVSSFSPLLARAAETFDDPNAARQLSEQAELLCSRGEAGAVRVNLQGTPLTFLAIGPQKLLVFRPRSAAAPAPSCYDALRVTVRDRKQVVLGEPLPDIHFCTQRALEHVQASAYPAIDRVLIQLPDQHERAGITVAWTHLLSFEASTGKKVASADLEAQVYLAFPSGTGFFYTSPPEPALKAWPADDRFPSGEDGWIPTNGRGDYGYSVGADAPFLFLQNKKQLAILDLNSRGLWAFDSRFGGTVEQTPGWPSLRPVRTSKGFAFIVPGRNSARVYSLTLSPGAQPAQLGVVPFEPKQLVAHGDTLQLTSYPLTWWEPVLGLMHDARVEDVLAHASDPNPPAPFALTAYGGQVNGLPSQLWEASADASGTAPISAHCYQLPADWRPVTSDGGTPPPLADDPAAKGCNDDWKVALQHVAKLKQQPFERAQTPQQAAGFCINALARQRSKELLRCVDLEAMIAAQGGREAALVAALIGAVSPNAKLDAAQLDALAEEEAAGPLASATKDVRFEVLQYLVSHEALPAPTLRAVSDKHFFADWRFEGDHPFTLTMGFGHSPVGKRKRLAWVLTDTSYTDEHGEVFRGQVHGKLPDRMF